MDPTSTTGAELSSDCVLASGECVGCSACLNACPEDCITMVEDFEGFLYPLVDLSKCVGCGLCRAVCPALHGETVSNDPVAFGCRAVDDTLRLASSSGGVFSLLARQVIDDGGVVFGAGFDDEFTVVHICAENTADVARLRGSKYVQSDIGRTYTQVEGFLRRGRRVLFSGTPCQIAGLQLFLQRSEPGLLCVDFFCHGVPSPRVWKRYIDFQECRFDSRVLEASFRSKDKGWRRFSMALHFASGVGYRAPLDRDPYMRAFLADICLRPSCYECRFKGVHRRSDITLADFWGIENVLPELDDDLGTSLVMANTSSGRFALDRLGAAADLKEVTLDAAVSFNSAGIHSASPHAMRDAFIRDLSILRFDILVRRYCPNSRLMRLRPRWTSAVRAVLRWAAR